jgi:hypothetical protein
MGIRASEKALRDAERKLSEECNRQFFIMYGSFGIALHDNWGWGQKRVLNLYETTDKIWHEIGETNRKSMLQLLEEETGIELRLTDSDRSWHELRFMNCEVDDQMKQLTLGEAIYMRMQQTRWMSAMIQACLLLALYRLHGFGPERLSRLLNQVDDIREKHHYKTKPIIQECSKLLNIDLVKKLKGRGE